MMKNLFIGLGLAVVGTMAVFLLFDGDGPSGGDQVVSVVDNISSEEKNTQSESNDIPAQNAWHELP